MASKLQMAADAIQRMAPSLQAVLDMAAELGKVGDIDSAREGAQRQLEQVRLDLKDMQGKLDQARLDVLAATDEASAKFAEANAEAQEILRKAADDASATRRKGQEDAEASLAAASEQASNLVTQARADADAARQADAEASAARASKLAETQAKISEAEGLLTIKRAELAAIESRVQEIHDNVAALTKGTA